MKVLAGKRLRFFVAVLGILMACAPDEAPACNVPAFRYALERWPADLYQVLVYHQTALRGEAYESLRRSAADADGAANYALKDVDVTTEEGKGLAARRRIAAFPWVEIFYPLNSRVPVPVWSGPLELERVSRVLNSPGRSVLAKRLLGGDVAVWILVRSGHDEKDRRAREILEAQLERASTDLKVPEIGTDLNGNPVEVSDFKTYPVHFSAIEIARDDPDEELLTRTLLLSEPDLMGVREPVAFPVFGRGRALYALVGDGIDGKNIREACQSMLNWCSCEIKALSPGTDLLIAADWSRPFGGKMVQDPELPLTGPGAFSEEQAASPAGQSDSKVQSESQSAAGPTVAPADCAAGVAPAGASPSAPVSGDDRIARHLLYLAGAAGVVLVALSALVRIKARR